MEKLIIYSETTPKDYFEYSRKQIFKYMIFAKPGTLGLATTCFLLLMYFHLSSIGYDFSLIFYIVCYFILNAVISFIDLAVTKAESQKSVDAYSGTQGRQKYEISKDGIRRFYKGADKLYAWEDFASTFESKSMIALFFKAGSYLMITKSAFENKEDFEFFKDCSEGVLRGITEKYD